MEKKQQETADKKILKQEIAVYSEKYNVQGKVMDYGVVTKLVFNYDGKDIEIGIHNNPLMNTDYVQTGRQILESYIENLSSKDRKVMLHNWYIEDHLSQRNGRYALAHGIVTGHTRLPDSIFCHTSKIRETYVNEEDELVILTMSHALQAGQRPRVKAKLRVVVVLQNVPPGLCRRPGQQLGAAGRGHRDAGREMMARRQVAEVRAALFQRGGG